LNYFGDLLGVGPPIENGFYYDFQRPTRSARGSRKDREKDVELQAKDLPYQRQYMEKEKGLKLYGDQPMKCELITEKADAVFSEYTLGPHFIDFCRGPHVPSTKKIKAFKLLSIAGAYWKGNEKNAQLQRIYGTAFFTKKELDDYLAKLEEASSCSPQAGRSLTPSDPGAR
jgi:threonyl-tRNA synthetase